MAWSFQPRPNSARRRFANRSDLVFSLRGVTLAFAPNKSLHPTAVTSCEMAESIGRRVNSNPLGVSVRSSVLLFRIFVVQLASFSAVRFRGRRAVAFFFSAFLGVLCGSFFSGRFALLKRASTSIQCQALDVFSRRVLRRVTPNKSLHPTAVSRKPMAARCGRRVNSVR